MQSGAISVVRSRILATLTSRESVKWRIGGFTVIQSTPCAALQYERITMERAHYWKSESQRGEQLFRFDLSHRPYQMCLLNSYIHPPSSSWWLEFDWGQGYLRESDCPSLRPTQIMSARPSERLETERWVNGFVSQRTITEERVSLVKWGMGDGARVQELKKIYASWTARRTIRRLIRMHTYRTMQ